VKVKYENIQGRPINLKPMPLSEVGKLREGDEVYIWWAKDGNPRDVRLDEICVIESAARYDRRDGKGLILDVGYGDFDLDDDIVAQLADECDIEWGGRGQAFFYYPPEQA
jgi:hypothetical protein